MGKFLELDFESVGLVKSQKAVRFSIGTRYPIRCKESICLSCVYLSVYLYGYYRMF